MSIGNRLLNSCSNPNASHISPISDGQFVMHGHLSTEIFFLANLFEGICQKLKILWHFESLKFVNRRTIWDWKFKTLLILQIVSELSQTL